MKIKKALLSVSDKTGIIELAKKLIQYDIEIISTGGTKRKLEEAGIIVTDITKVTNNPEAFGGRMKTISFNIESALLFDRETDKTEAEELNIEPIDLVVCNLYPFEEVLNKGADFEILIENIDIGGPTMIRAAAKNFKYVTVLTSPTDYNNFIKIIDNGKGETNYEYRKELMAKAFNHTADYDALIAQTMDLENGKKSLRLSFVNGKTLRYGENSHQQAEFYKQSKLNNTLHGMNILHGKALSYNNILDISGAIASIKELNRESCSVVKHSNPCGLSETPNQLKSLELAWQGDPISAFGSIIAFNTPLKKETVEFFNFDNPDKSKRKFIEVVIAPTVEKEALEYLQIHKNIRVLEYKPKSLAQSPDLRIVNGTLLKQDYDSLLYQNLELVTSQAFDIDTKLVEFGLKAIKNIKSNAIIVVGKKDDELFLMGMGAGQPNRLIATQLALLKAKEFITGNYQGDENYFEDFYQNEISKAYLISDAFFPFADNVELAAKEGIKTIVQPGGSIRDKSVINTCNELNLNMIFTNTRHFKH